MNLAKAIVVALIIAGGYAAYRYRAKAVAKVVAVGSAIGAGLRAVITKKIP